MKPKNRLGIYMVEEGEPKDVRAERAADIRARFGAEALRRYELQQGKEIPAATHSGLSVIGGTGRFNMRETI